MVQISEQYPRLGLVRCGKHLVIDTNSLEMVRLYANPPWPSGTYERNPSVLLQQQHILRTNQQVCSMRPRDCRKRSGS
jgi:hypothetical protein